MSKYGIYTVVVTLIFNCCISRGVTTAIRNNTKNKDMYRTRGWSDTFQRGVKTLVRTHEHAETLNLNELLPHTIWIMKIIHYTPELDNISPTIKNKTLCLRIIHCDVYTSCYLSYFMTHLENEVKNYSPSMYYRF